MNGVSLFSGAGIGELCFEHILPDYRTIAYVEIDKYCRSTLRARIRDGVLDDAPIFDDIRGFNARYASLYAGKVDWLSGGFPCQPFSVAGRQLGEADERNMWPETRDAIGIIRPAYVFLENVPGLSAAQKFIVLVIQKVRQLNLFDTGSKKSVAGNIIRKLFKVVGTSYASRIFGDLAEIGYDCEWDVVGASDVGAPHRRKRLWILAYPQSIGHRQGRGQRDIHKENGGSNRQRGTVASSPSTQSEDMADTAGQRSEWWRTDPADDKGWWYQKTRGQGKSDDREEHGIIEPELGRVADGVAHRVDRLKALGNGWVPQVVARILQVGGE
jgi:DNA (cytosine-5)-methyltransferase 1